MSVSSNAPVIRLATPTDAEAIVQVHVAAWRHSYRGLLPDAMLDEVDVESRTARRRDYLTSLPTPHHRPWLIHEGDALRGFAFTGPARDEDAVAAGAHELFAIYLVPDGIGTGLGRRLMTHVQQDLEQRGIPELVLWVLERNARAHRFYAAAGLTPDPRVPSRPFLEDAPEPRKIRLWRRLGA